MTSIVWKRIRSFFWSDAEISRRRDAVLQHPANDDALAANDNITNDGRLIDPIADITIPLGNSKMRGEWLPRVINVEFYRLQTANKPPARRL